MSWTYPHPNSQHHQQPNEGGSSSNSNSNSNSKAKSTLLIRHLPEAIPFDNLSRLFSHYGALSVRPCSAPRLRNCAFVDFNDDVAASQAQRQLNGLRFLGKVLSVEKSIKPSDNTVFVGGEPEKKPLNKDISQSGGGGGGGHDGSNSATLLAAQPIADKLGINYPFPPHLEYAYPPPDGNILTNILNALIAVPRFYTQVLHLMNKMNIPAPFRMALPTPPLPSTPAPPPPPLPSVTETPHPANMSSDESEMETSDEDVDEAEAPRKRIKREVIVGPGIDKDVSHEAVGLKPATLVPKEKLLVKKKNPILQIKIVPKKVQQKVCNENMINDHPEKMESAEAVAYATIEQIESQKLPPEEILSLPMFKNYTAGNPASVLYIKNLAKDVAADDFYFIFGSFFGSVDAAKSSLSVKLMQEGRMRGQAFVTFPSVELAHRALNVVNGYVFKGKPMIMQFGRNPAASKTS